MAISVRSIGSEFGGHRVFPRKANLDGHLEFDPAPCSSFEPKEVFPLFDYQRLCQLKILLFSTVPVSLLIARAWNRTRIGWRRRGMSIRPETVNILG